MDHWNAVDILEKIWQESAKLFCCVKRFCQIFQNYTMDACILWKMFLYTLNTRTITEKKGKTHNINGKFKKKIRHFLWTIFCNYHTCSINRYFSKTSKEQFLLWQYLKCTVTLLLWWVSVNLKIFTALNTCKIYK